MFSKFISILAVFSVLWTNTVIATGPVMKKQDTTVLSKVDYSLSDRYGNTFVNNVFADNILLTIAYMRGIARAGQPVNWNDVRGDFTYTLLLKPGETFAFHDEVLPQFRNSQLLTTGAHFDSFGGFESDGWLVGDGVCHLASFMNVAAREAHLTVLSPTPHNFATIADVPRAYGVAIYYSPNDPAGSSLQNLYITNTFSTPVAFVFAHQGNQLKITVEKVD